MSLAHLDRRWKKAWRPCVKCGDPDGPKGPRMRTPYRSSSGCCLKCYAVPMKRAWEAHIRNYYEAPPPPVPQRPTYIMGATDDPVVLPMPNPPPPRLK